MIDFIQDCSLMQVGHLKKAPAIPAHLPSKVKQLLSSCFKADPIVRPSSLQVAKVRGSCCIDILPKQCSLLGLHIWVCWQGTSGLVLKDNTFYGTLVHKDSTREVHWYVLYLICLRPSSVHTRPPKVKRTPLCCAVLCCAVLCCAVLRLLLTCMFMSVE
jgi:hypothetical protein